MFSDINSDLIEKVFANVQEAISASDLVCYCQILAGIFALAYIGNIFWKSWGRGQELHITDFAKPFVVLFCIMNFSLVVGALDSLIYEPLNKGTLALVEDNNNIMDELSKYQAKVEKIQREKDEEKSTWQTVKDSVKSVGTFFEKSLYFAVMSIFNILAQLLCLIAKTCMIAYSYLLRIILVIFGPIAFAFSLIPYFSDNIKNWLGKYIGALLYIPICNVILYITQCFATALFQLYNTDLSHQDATINDVLNSSAVVSIMFIVSACAYFTVPSLAGFIVSMAQSAGNTSIGNTVKSAAVIAGTLTAAAVTGGASLATAGDEGFLQSLGNIINHYKTNKSEDSGSDKNGNDNSGIKGDG